MKQDLTSSSFYKLKLNKNRLFDIYKSEPKEETEFDLITRNCMTITKPDNIYDDLPSSNYHDHCNSTDDEGPLRTLTYLSQSKESLTSRLNIKEVYLQSVRLNNAAPIRLKLKEIPNNLMLNLVNPNNPQFKMSKQVKSLIKTKRNLKINTSIKGTNPDEHKDNSLFHNVFINKHKSSNAITIENEPIVSKHILINRQSRDAYYNNDLNMNTISADVQYHKFNKLKFFSVERKKKDIIDTYNKQIALLNKKENKNTLFHSKYFFNKYEHPKPNINIKTNKSLFNTKINQEVLQSSINKTITYRYFNNSNKKYLITKA